MADLWVERYRPKVLNDYVFQDSRQQTMFQSWVNEGNIPHLLLTGPAGTGKTTAARMLVNELKIEPYDFLEVNASNETKIEIMRDKILNFASTRPFGKMKVILLDEADYLSHNSQALLRNTIETYQDTCRFILTANFAHKINPALHSRCYKIHIGKLDINEFTARAATVLVQEQIEFELDTLDTYVRASYPDLRRCLMLLQNNSVEGRLANITENDQAGLQEWMVAAVELIKQRDLRSARKIICSSIQAEDVETLYRWMYDNIDFWGDTDEQKDQALLIIRRAYVNSSLVADQEINLSACFAELATIER